jgi:hypothetical protein
MTKKSSRKVIQSECAHHFIGNETKIKEPLWLIFQTERNLIRFAAQNQIHVLNRELFSPCETETSVFENQMKPHCQRNAPQTPPSPL